MLLPALLLALPVLAGSIQDDPAATRGARFQEYLDRSPYHEQVFRSMVEAARALGESDALLQAYRRRVVEQPDALAPRVVLARLLGEAGRFAQAAEHLRVVHPPSAEARRLMARMQVRAGQLPAALATLDGALLLDPDPELARELQLERADLFLARGEPQHARQAYAAVADLARDDPAHLFDVAGLLADAGFPEDGVALLEEARVLVTDDVPRSARLLAELGRLQERAANGRAALDAYQAALELLGHGHWLRRELLARSLDLHRRAGSLGEAAVRYRVRLASEPGDREARLALVEALTLDRRPREALDELRRATQLHPEDLDLSDRFARALHRAGEEQAYLRELQRALERAPRHPRRRFELGAGLAARGDHDAAEREWARLIDATGGDPAQADRVAREWARLDQPERAAAVWRAAIERAPTVVRRYGDLARLLHEHGAAPAARQVLGQAERAVAGRPSELDELAEVYLALEDPRSARRVLETAQRLDARTPARLGRLADAALAQGDQPAARDALVRWLALAPDEHQRRAAQERYCALFEGAARRVEIARLVQVLAAGAEQRAPYLLLAHFQRLAGDHERAWQVLERLLVRAPDDVAARAQMARDLAQAGRHGPALIQLEDLVVRDPRRAALHLLDQVDLLVRLSGRQDDVAERLERLRRLPPGDPGTWRAVARGYERIGRRSDAADCLAQALRMEPDDGAAHLALARLYQGTGRREEAIERFQLAWRHGQDDVRTQAVAGLHALLAEGRDLQRELRRLRVTSRRDPFDADTPRLLAELALREGDAVEAVRVLGDLLRREGDDPALLRRRAEAYVELGRSGPALADVTRLAELGQDVDGLITTLTRPQVEGGEVARSMELGYLMRDPSPVAQQLAGAGRARSAIDFLRRYERRRGALPPAARLLIADLYVREGERRQALRALEDYEAENGPSWPISRRLGDLHHALHDRRAALEQGRRMLAQGAPQGVLEDYFEQKASRAELTRLRTREVLDAAGDARAVEAGLAELSTNLYDAPQALDLLQKLRGRALRNGLFPDGTTLEAWTQVLDEWALRFYRSNRRLVAPRLEQLAKRRYALGAPEWVEYLWLHHLVGDDERPSMFGDRPGARRVAAEEVTPAERAVERFPDRPEVLYAAARYARLEGRHALAADLLRRLLERLAAPDELAREASLRARSLARHAEAVLAEAPPHPDLTPDSALLERLARLTHRPAQARGGLPTVPDRAATVVHLARALAAAGQPAQARAAFQALPAPHPEALLERLELAGARLQVGQVRPVLAELVAVGRLRARLAEQAPFDGFLAWQEQVDAAMARVTAAWVWRRVLRAA